MEWAIENPAVFDERAPDIGFDVGKALEYYYTAAVQATSQKTDTRKIGARHFVARRIPEIGITVAIEQELRRRIVSHSLADMTSDSGVTKSAVPTQFEDVFLFAGGLAAALDDW